MINWYAQHSMYRNAYELLGRERERRADGSVGVVKAELIVEARDPNELYEPTLAFHPEEAQQIMNALWDCGLRPNNGAGAVAHTESLQAHLADLRTIAYHALKISSR